MTNGIYCYIDKKTNKVVYVGKDSYIDKNKRHKDHNLHCHYDIQPFNRILQNNPNRYEYKVLKEGNFSENLLNALEIIYIQRYNTFRPQTNHGYNFTIGGDGKLGYKHSNLTKKKISQKLKGKNNPMYNKSHIKETKEKISKALKGKKLSDITKIKISKAHQGKKHTKEARKKMSLNQSKKRSTSGYYRVSKKKDTSYRQNFKWVYRYYDDIGKRKEISSADIKKLEEKVKNKGLKWLKFED